MTFEEFEAQDYEATVLPTMSPTKGSTIYQPVLDKMLEGKAFTVKELKDVYNIKKATYLTQALKKFGYKVINDRTWVQHEGDRKRCYNKYRLHSKHLKA